MALFIYSVLLSLHLIACFVEANGKSRVSNEVEFWLTTADKSSLLQRQANAVLFPSGGSNDVTIDTSVAGLRQVMEGFGWCMTGGSAMLMLAQPAFSPLFQELFGEKGLSSDYLRVTIGASDLDAQAFSYDDISCNSTPCTDPQLKQFSLSQDMHVIRALRIIRSLNPNIKLMGSPWSPPTWMKTNGNFIGGELKEEWMAAYASYFVRYVQEMARHNLPIWGITVQNEPLNPDNEPSLFMPAATQLKFIRDHLGPQFKQNNITTRIIIYDHNADRIDYPIEVLTDPSAAQYIDGSAFHLYAGPMSALSTVHDKFPTKNLYFTEQWTGAPENSQQFGSNFLWDMEGLVVNATQNWCKTVLKWNLASDDNWRPHTPRGCLTCLGALTLYQNGTVIRTSAYYSMAHASKFVPNGSFHLKSSNWATFPHTAFMRPDGRIAIIVVNNKNVATSVTIGLQPQRLMLTSSLPAFSAATYIWPPTDRA